VFDPSVFRNRRRALGGVTARRGDAAVDNKAGAGHEVGVVRGEKDDALGGVGHCLHAANRQPCQRLLPRGVEVVGAEIAARISTTWSPISVSVVPGWIELTNVKSIKPLGSTV
jgi:hypothetical protein